MWFPFHTDWISDQDSPNTCLTKVNIFFVTLELISVHERLHSIVVLLHEEKFYVHLKRNYCLENETLPISSLTLFKLCVPLQKRCLELVADQKRAYRMKLLSMKLVQSYSNTTPVTFLLVIFERMTGSRWDLLQKHYVFVPVLCMSNFLRSQQSALSGTCLHRAGMGTICSTCGPLDRQTSHDFFLGNYLKKGCTGINLTPWKLWRIIL